MSQTQTRTKRMVRPLLMPFVSKPPSPYTPCPSSNPSVDEKESSSQSGQPSTQESKAEFLRRALIEIVAFTYKVNKDELGVALQESGLPPKLSESELAWLMQLSATIKELRAIVKCGAYSAIKEFEKALVYSNVIIPAEKLNLMFGWVVRQLREFAEHHCRSGRENRTQPYKYRVMILGCFPLDLEDVELARTLSTHDLMIRELAPNEKIRVLLGTGLRRFREKYQHKTVSGADGTMW